MPGRVLTHRKQRKKRPRSPVWACSVEDLIKEEPIGFPWFEEEEDDDDVGDITAEWEEREPRMTGVQAVRRAKNGEQELLVEWDPTPESGEKFTWVPMALVPSSIKEMFFFQENRRHLEGHVTRQKERSAKKNAARNNSSMHSSEVLVIDLSDEPNSAAPKKAAKAMQGTASHSVDVV
mmetsp:Transcript_714/g.2363  ORF Transcript_714/g.2363 Transcript_714/m.2363 type:complete len:178 (+) Transcript_714:280-813(+)